MAPVEGPGLAAHTALLLLKGYKILISPLLTGSCRFVPSCSDYAAEAIQVHGAIKGTGFALRRLARCHPFGQAGHDPIPPAEHRANGSR